MNRRQKGKFYERIAAAYLQEQGLEMIEQNFFCPIGEIDLIAREDTCLVFVEVKYRSSLQKGYPVEAVSFSKQKRIYRVAQWYLQKHPLQKGEGCRFDVVSIYRTEITWIPNAFGGF